jgi:tripartite-type tricarboxylate transporter receptor subunit TctC
MNAFARLTAAIAVAAIPAIAFAQGQYPVKPIRLMVNYPPGGPADIIGRALANKLAPFLGQPVVVDNRSGASGVIGADHVAKSPPDGYTVLISAASPLVIAPGLAKVPYDPFKDFVPVTQVVAVPQAVVAIPKLGVRTLAALVAYAKANPGKVSFASAGTAGLTHLAGELLKREAAIDIVHVPYRGAAPAVNDLLGGQVEIMFADIPVLLPHVQSGKLIALAVGDARRAPSLPEVPTTTEAGFPAVMANNWYALLVPAGTPREVVLKLNQAAATALTSSDLREQLAKQGAGAVGGSPEELGALMRAETARWVPLGKSVGAVWE